MILICDTKTTLITSYRVIGSQIPVLDRQEGHANERIRSKRPLRVGDASRGAAI